jgi:hypothetical protein
VPKRSIQDARRVFEREVVPSTSDHGTKQGRARLDAAENRAREEARRYVAGREQEAMELRDQALRTLTECRDAYEELHAEGSEARVSATDYTATLNRLRTRHRTPKGFCSGQRQFRGTSRARAKGGKSAGQSADEGGFLNRVSQVRFLPGAPRKVPGQRPFSGD